MRSNPSSRLWVGPVMLAIIVALIYLLSIMPTTAPHLTSSGIIINDGHTEYAMKGQVHVEWDEIRFKHNSPPEQINDFEGCLNGGISNETDGSCVCTRWYSGEKCEISVCMNDGFYNFTLGKCECLSNWFGEHCTLHCSTGVVNKTSGMCECVFGRPCTLQKCINGQFLDGKCVCYDGFTGPACTICDGTVNNIQCDDVIRKRGAVNSRLTLSGLSFCIITIGLLCVGARRRRLQMSPMGDETWYRVFHPSQNRPFRCRHDYMCGGSWVPRDRALIVAPGRVSMSTATPRIHRLATPPPSYTSVDELNIEQQQQQPPTYEEATRIDMEPVQEVDDHHSEVMMSVVVVEQQQQNEQKDECVEINSNRRASSQQETTTTQTDE